MEIKIIGILCTPTPVLQTHFHDAEELLLMLNGLTHVICVHVSEDIGGEKVPVGRYQTW